MDSIIGGGKLHLRRLQDGSVVVLLDVPEPRHVVLTPDEGWEVLGALSSMLGNQNTWSDAVTNVELVEDE